MGSAIVLRGRGTWLQDHAALLPERATQPQDRAALLPDRAALLPEWATQLPDRATVGACPASRRLMTASVVREQYWLQGWRSW